MSVTIFKIIFIKTPFSKIGIAYTHMYVLTHTHFCIMLGLIIKVLSNLFYLSAYSSDWLFWIEIFVHRCIEIRKIIYLWAVSLFLHISVILQSPDPDCGKLGKRCDFVFWITVRITYTITINFLKDISLYCKNLNIYISCFFLYIFCILICWATGNL